MKCLARSLVMVAGVLMVASRAIAQEPDLAKPYGGSVTVGGQYTDNRDGLKNDKQSNVDLYIEPRGDLYWRDGEHTTLDIFLAPLAKWHSNPRTASDGDPQHRTDMFGSGGIDLSHEFTPLLNLTFNDTLSYDDDPTVDLGGTGVRQNSSVLFNDAHGDITAELTPQVGLELIGHDAIKRYTDSTVAADENEQTVETEADVGYTLGSGYKVFGLAGFSSFDNESTTHSRGANVYSIGLGVEKRLNANVHARVSGGYQDAHYSDTAFDDKGMANGKADLVFRPDSPTRFRVTTMYGFYTPYVQPYSVQKLFAVQGAIDHDLLPARLTATLRGQYSDSEYDAEGAGAPGGSDKLTSAGVDVTYRLNRNWGVTVGYTFENWNSEVREDFSRNTVDASVKASF